MGHENTGWTKLTNNQMDTFPRKKPAVMWKSNITPDVLLPVS